MTKMKQPLSKHHDCRFVVKSKLMVSFHLQIIGYLHKKLRNRKKLVVSLIDLLQYKNYYKLCRRSMKENRLRM